MNEQNYIERYWRDATPEDAIKEPPMVARFRYEDAEDWEYDLLVGWDRTDQCHWRSELDAFEHCQVYDAPDPGEGWRLIDKEKDAKKPGDEYLDSERGWRPAGCNIGFLKGHTYRRRTTPAVTYVPFTWEDRDQLRGRWITWKHENGLMIESQINHINQHRDGGLWFKSHDAKWLLENATFIVTGKPVGKEVVQ